MCAGTFPSLLQICPPCHPDWEKEKIKKSEEGKKGNRNVNPAKIILTWLIDREMKNEEGGKERKG